MDNGQQHEYIQELLIQLNGIEEKLGDIKARWPAHSVHANMVTELEDLEEERDCLLGLLNTSQKV